ncbi:hypothetical protein AX15_002894 [Amanita polypyramis BW_CC]|nr:hypothetical protein AX15_002894 [Amanita polypyramis BW_CC]
MADLGAPPIIPTGLQQYNSYVQDPKWQIKFTIVWTSVLGTFVIAASPRLLKRIRDGSLLAGAVGITEDARAYERIAEKMDAEVEEIVGRSGVTPRTRVLFMEKALNVLRSVLYWIPPWLDLNVGQIFIVCAYLAVTITCIVCQVPLIDNPNRAGFVALAQLPPVFLFATKNSIVSFLLGPGTGYERLNFIHRWAGRGLFLGGLIHGSLWIRDHLSYGQPILGQQKETSGVACFSLLCIIVLTSLRPIRRYMWNVFWIIHFLCYVAFFITLCYHTIYARPWIYAPLALYGLDLLMRMVRIRIQDATLVPVDKQMTLVHIPYATSGWAPGQHVRLRVFFQGRLFESHPFTIMCAPPTEGCLSRPLPSATKSKYAVEDKHAFPDAEGMGYTGSGIVLGICAAGNWTKALNSFTHNEGQRLRRSGRDQLDIEGAETVAVPVYTTIDGPYGGCTIDPAAYERVLFVSGGSGATFTIGLLDELVGKRLRTGQVVTRRIEFVWYTRSYATIRWFASFLSTIALHAATCPDLDLCITIYVTRSCDHEELPRIPNCDVSIARPRIREVVRRVVEGSPDLEKKEGSIFEGSVETDRTSWSEKMVVDTEGGISEWGPLSGGGLAVCASGPQSVTRETANAVAALSASGRGRELGRIALHTEVFAV